MWNEHISLLQLKEVISELESDMSQSQASSEQSPKATNSSSNSDEESSDPSVNSGCSFEEVSVGSETFCLVPKPLMKFVPTAPMDLEYLEGRGPVEVGNEYLYIPRNLLTELKLVINQSRDLQKEVKLCRELLWSQYGSGDQLPPFEPSTVKQTCLSAGGNKLFQTIFHAMSSDDHSANRQILNEKKTVAVIYMLIFGQSQKASWFQKLISSAVVSKGISEGGLSILHQSGIATSKSTQRREMHKSAKNHDNVVREFITDAAEKRAMLVFMVDDFTNVHTKRRPTDQKTSTASNMATLLLKRFNDGSAIPVSGNIINPNGIATSALTEFLDKSLPSLSATFASLMPHWVRSSFFDPEAERTRVDFHNYQAQQIDVTAMRKMNGCRLLDSIEIPLKGFENFLKAACHAKEQGLGSYLEQFVCPQPGDWPAQFYMRQVQNYASKNKSLHPLSNIIPFLGPLHIQRNARECVCLLNISFFKRVYKFIFGPNKILANKPKPWRVSLLLEVLYGGWTLIRDQVIVAFSNCKDVQYLTLLNLLDNYLPLVLSIYSIAFKSGNTDQFVDPLFRCWVMFFCFKRRHYNKAPLVWLSNFLHWKSVNHPMYFALMNMLNAFDEYPVEHFHLILRAQCKESDNGDMLRQKATAIDSMKESSSNFRSTYAVPKHHTAIRGRLAKLKLSAAEFLCNVLQEIKDKPHNASVVTRPKGAKKKHQILETSTNIWR